MGFFNTKKVHSVNATVSRIVEDHLIPDAIKQGVVTSIYQNDNQLVENVLEGLIGCIGVKAHNMYAYAKTKYTYGLPSKSTLLSDTGKVDVESAIETLIDPAATIVYYHFGPLNNLHMGWLSLVTDHGYVSSTNTLGVLSAAKGTSVYLKDMRVILTQASYDTLGINGLEQWGMPPSAGYTPERITSLGALATHTPYALDALATVDSVLVTYVWQETRNVVINGVTVPQTLTLTDAFNIPFPTLMAGEEDDDYFQVKYLNGANEGYWIYKHGAGTLPALDALFDTEHDVALGSFFPIGYYRYNNTSAASDPTSDGYKTSKRMAKYLGIDYADMIEQIHDNPDINGVEQALLIMAVPANSTNPAEQRYLYDFFDRVAIESGITETAATTAITNALSNTGRFWNKKNAASVSTISFTIQDARFKMVFGCDTITRTKKAGVIAAVGEYSSAYSPVSYTIYVQDADSEGSPLYTYDARGNAIPVMIPKTYLVPTHYYRYQLSDAVYEEVAVTRLKMMYYIWGGMTSVGDENDPLLLIPLDYSITKEYSIPVREELYIRSLHFVFTSHVITKIKWYQKSAFKIIFIIVAIVILIVTQGASLKATIAAWLAMSATQLFWAILTLIVKYLVFSTVFKLFVKAVGTKASFIVAVLAIVAASMGYFNAGTFQGVVWADKLLFISNGLSSAIGDAIQQGMIDLQNEATAFDLFMTEQTKLLDTANELLETTSILSPFVVFGESPDDFYSRTVHSGNIGVVGIDAVSYYVDNALTLPEMKDTIGVNQYV